VKVVSRYCDSCGVKIPASEIEDQIALKYEESYYCKDCKADILPLIDKKGGNGASGGKSLAKAARAGAEATRAESKGDAPDKKPAGAKITSGSRPAVGAAAKAASGTRPAVGATKSASASTGSAARTGAKPPGSSTPGKGAPAARTPLKGAAPVKGALVKKPVSKRPPDEDEPEDAEEGSQEELDAEDASKKNKLLIPAIAGGALLLIVIVAVLMNGGDKASDPKALDPGKKSPMQVAKEKSEKVWKDGLALVASKPTAEQIKTLNDVIHSGAILDQNVMDAAEKQLEEMTEAYMAKGREEFDKLNAKAKALAESERYEEAIDAFRGFAPELRGTKWYLNNTRAEIERLQLLLQAKNEAEPLMRKADAYAKEKEYLVAAGVLEGFDVQEYSKSPWADKITKRKQGFDDLASKGEEDAAMAELAKKEQERIAAEQAEKKKKMEEEDKRIAGLNWTQIPTDDLFTWKLPEPAPKEAWKTQGKELIGSAGGAMQENIAAMAGCGDKRWIDYILEFKYKVVKGGFMVGVRASGQAFCKLEPAFQADGQYHTMTISVRGTEDDAFMLVQPDGSKVKVKFDAHDSMQGGVAFCLLPNSECVFTEVRVKVINKSAN